QASLQLFQKIFESGPKNPFLLLVTARDDQESKTYVTGILSKVSEYVREEISVASFSKAQMMNLLSEYLGATSLDASIADELYGKSKGNPFIAIEYLRAGIAQGF